MTDYQDKDSLNGVLVELTAPDGTVYRFTYVATIPYAQEDYVVLMELEADGEGNEQLLITRLLNTVDGELSFVVVEEEDIITAVFEKYVAQSLSMALDEDTDDCDCGHDCDSGCGHQH